MEDLQEKNECDFFVIDNITKETALHLDWTALEKSIEKFNSYWYYHDLYPRDFSLGSSETIADLDLHI